MATDLLHCYICPKRPNFSDASHLLTHVSSKGHLSHLHKLQIRSHQEEIAVQQLALYNQWFAEHNVAHLLSERMLQKEAKQAKKKADNKRRLEGTRQAAQLDLDPSLLPDPAQYTASSHGLAFNSSLSIPQPEFGYADAASSEFSPSQLLSTYPEHAIIPNSTWTFSPREPTNSQSSITQAHGAVTPEMAKLKGIIWPGMDIFDSADEITQRKRNQRKDVSVLARMQAMSELVEPMETVCSPGGRVKKRRHMDELEDDSPVEGESPLVKQSLKRKRKPLKTIANNRSRLPLFRTKQRYTAEVAITTPTKQPFAHTSSKVYHSRNTFTLKQNPIVTAPLASSNDVARGRRKRRDFAIFNDHSSEWSPDTNVSILPNPLLDNNRSFQPARSFTQPSQLWPQTPRQANHLVDPFTTYRSSQSESNQDFTTGKENVNPTWQKDLKSAHNSPVSTPYYNFGDFDDHLGALAEVYAFTKNPLLGSVPSQSSPEKQSLRRLAANQVYAEQNLSFYR